jgi:hypothetical protein
MTDGDKGKRTFVITKPMNGEVYAWVCRREYTPRLFELIGEQAADPLLNLTWQAAAEVTELIRRGQSNPPADGEFIIAQPQH